VSLLHADREERAVLVGEPLPTILNRLRARVEVPQHLSALPEHDYEWFMALPFKSWLPPPLLQEQARCRHLRSSR